MAARVTQAQVVVITGQPGVGKSTICHLLAGRRELAAHVKADNLHRMIVSGGEWPSAGTAAAHDQLLARTQNAAYVARTLASIGVSVFLDEVIASQEQLVIVDAAIGRAHWIVLSASRAVIAERDAGRSKHTAFAYFDIGMDIERLLVHRATVIDTSALGAERTAQLVEVALTRDPFVLPFASP
jgi:predicted kinase